MLRTGLRAFVRLSDLVIADNRWTGRCKNWLAHANYCDAMFGWNTYGSGLASLERYFFHFAMAARAGR